MDDSMQQLLDDFLADPEAYDEEKLLALQKKVNPYAYSLGEGAQQLLALSLTNLREKYLCRFIATSMVGFVFQMQREWEVPAVQRRWVPKRKGGGDAPEAAATTPHRPDHFGAALNRLSQQACAYEAFDAQAQAALAARSSAKADAAAAELLAADAPADMALAKVAQAAHLQAGEAAKRATKAAALAHQARLETALMFEGAGADATARLAADIAEAEENPESADFGRSVRLNRPASGAIEMPAKAAAEIVAGFLRSLFEFDPNAHVRSAFDEFVLAARVPTAEAAAEVADVARRHAAAHNYTAQPPPTVDLQDPGRPSLDELRALRPAADPTRGALEHIPPQDTFHRFDYYRAVNFEALREATAAIYHEKPDLDLAINPYEVLCSDETGTAIEKFDRFKALHSRDVIADILAVQFGSWTVLGDFAQNRAKVDVLGPEMGILKRIFDRHEEDAKIGKDLMGHRIRRAKAKNIAMAGADDPGLAQYIKHGTGKGSAAASGGRRVLSSDELADLEKAKGDLTVARRIAEDKSFEAVGYARALCAAADRIANDVPPTPEDLLIIGGERFRVTDDDSSLEALAGIYAAPAEFEKIYATVRARVADIDIRSAADQVVGLSDRKLRQRRLSDADARLLRDSLSRLETAREQAQVPDDAVQTYVYHTDGDAIQRSTRFIQSEAPAALGAALDQIEHKQERS